MAGEGRPPPGEDGPRCSVVWGGMKRWGREELMGRVGRINSSGIL